MVQVHKPYRSGAVLGVDGDTAAQGAQKSTKTDTKVKEKES